MMPADQNPEKVSFVAKGRVSDAKERNWVDNFCPEWSQPFLRLSRMDRPIGTWLLLIPCWWGLLVAILQSGGTLISLKVLWIAIVCILGAILMRGAGCTWNDITDRNLDAKVARSKSRPLPSGLISLKLAVIWMIIQLILSAILLLTLNWFAVFVGVLSLVVVVIYPFAKRFTWWPQLFLGFAFNWGVLLSWSAYQNSLSISPLFLYIAGIFWTLFYDTIYAHQDKEDDVRIGIKSTALRLGSKTTRWLHFFLIGVVVFYILTMSTIYFEGPRFFSLLFCVVGILLMSCHLFVQIKKLDINDAEKCLTLFRSNRDSGLLLVASLCLAVFV